MLATSPRRPPPAPPFPGLPAHAPPLPLDLSALPPRGGGAPDLGRVRDLRDGVRRADSVASFASGASASSDPDAVGVSMDGLDAALGAEEEEMTRSHWTRAESEQFSSESESESEEEEGGRWSESDRGSDSGSDSGSCSSSEIEAPIIVPPIRRRPRPRPSPPLHAHAYPPPSNPPAYDYPDPIAISSRPPLQRLKTVDGSPVVIVDDIHSALLDSAGSVGASVGATSLGEGDVIEYSPGAVLAEEEEDDYVSGGRDMFAKTRNQGRIWGSARSTPRRQGTTGSFPGSDSSKAGSGQRSFSSAGSQTEASPTAAAMAAVAAAAGAGAAAVKAGRRHSSAAPEESARMRGGEARRKPALGMGRPPPKPLGSPQKSPVLRPTATPASPVTPPRSGLRTPPRSGLQPSPVGLPYVDLRPGNPPLQDTFSDLSYPAKTSGHGYNAVPMPPPKRASYPDDINGIASATSAASYRSRSSISSDFLSNYARNESTAELALVRVTDTRTAHGPAASELNGNSSDALRAVAILLSRVKKQRLAPYELTITAAAGTLSGQSPTVVTASNALNLAGRAARVANATDPRSLPPSNTSVTPWTVVPKKSATFSSGFAFGETLAIVAAILSHAGDISLRQGPRAGTKAAKGAAMDVVLDATAGSSFAATATIAFRADGSGTDVRLRCEDSLLKRRKRRKSFVAMLAEAEKAWRSVGVSARLNTAERTAATMRQASAAAGAIQGIAFGSVEGGKAGKKGQA